MGNGSSLGRRLPWLALGAAALVAAVLYVVAPRATGPGAAPAPEPEPDGPSFAPALEPLPQPIPGDRLRADFLAGKDPGGERFLAWLREAAAAPERSGAISACAEAWLETRKPHLMVPLREYPGELAGIAAERLPADPKGGLDLIATFGFPGGVRDDRFFASTSLRAALVLACEPSGDPEAAAEAGPERAKALWIAGRARIKEAIPAIRRAAGLLRDESGMPLPGDPYGPARDQAMRIVAGNSPARPEPKAGPGAKAAPQAGRPTTRGRALASSPR